MSEKINPSEISIIIRGEKVISVPKAFSKFAKGLVGGFEYFTPFFPEGILISVENCHYQNQLELYYRPTGYPGIYKQTYRSEVRHNIVEYDRSIEYYESFKETFGAPYPHRKVWIRLNARAQLSLDKRTVQEDSCRLEIKSPKLGYISVTAAREEGKIIIDKGYEGEVEGKTISIFERTEIDSQDQAITWTDIHMTAKIEGQLGNYVFYLDPSGKCTRISGYGGENPGIIHYETEKPHALYQEQVLYVKTLRSRVTSMPQYVQRIVSNPKVLLETRVAFSQRNPTMLYRVGSLKDNFEEVNILSPIISKMTD